LEEKVSLLTSKSLIVQKGHADLDGVPIGGLVTNTETITHSNY